MSEQTQMFPKTAMDEAVAVLNHLIAEEEKADKAVDSAQQKLYEARDRTTKQRHVIAGIAGMTGAAVSEDVDGDVEDAEFVDETHQVEPARTVGVSFMGAEPIEVEPNEREVVVNLPYRVAAELDSKVETLLGIESVELESMTFAVIRDGDERNVDGAELATSYRGETILVVVLAGEQVDPITGEVLTGEAGEGECVGDFLPPRGDEVPLGEAVA